MQTSLSKRERKKLCFFLSSSGAVAMTSDVISFGVGETQHRLRLLFVETLEIYACFFFYAMKSAQIQFHFQSNFSHDFGIKLFSCRKISSERDAFLRLRKRRAKFSRRNKTVNEIRFVTNVFPFSLSNLHRREWWEFSLCNFELRYVFSRPWIIQLTIDCCEWTQMCRQFALFSAWKMPTIRHWEKSMCKYLNEWILRSTIM